MNWLVRLMDRASVLLALVGTLGLVAMMLHISLDIILRSTVSVSIPATLELVTRYYMVSLALLPLAWVEWRREMIFVEALDGFFGDIGVRVVDVLVSVLSAGIYIVLTIATWSKAIEQYEIGSYVMSLSFPMPVWPTYFILPIAFGLAAMVTIIRIPLIAKNTLLTDRV
ncbi:MAG: TRAP transporter small permease subunit [Pseudomonas sp.]|nr:TRAP transporter small permease subunit [Pseudomonas sp.]